MDCLKKYIKLFFFKNNGAKCIKLKIKEFKD